MRVLLGFIFVLPLGAVEFFVSPAGAGRMTGEDAGNAAPAGEIGGIFNEEMGPGDTLRLAAGEYRDLSVSLEKGGAEGKPKTITGPEKGGAVWTSSWTIEKPDKGPTAVNLGAGLSHVTVCHLEFKGYQKVVMAKKSTEKPRTDLVVQNLKMSFMRHGFYLSDCDNLTLKGCHLTNYSKHGFRFEEGCDGVEVIDCEADCSLGDADWESKTELLPFGFNVNNGGAPNTKLRFFRCKARNNVKSNQKAGYTNGDGFVVEGNTEGVKFVQCESVRNTDGGFDVKPEVSFLDCLAMDNRRDFRVWSTGVLINCVSAKSSTGLWCNGGPVTARDCSFINNGKTAAMTDDKAKEPITLETCLIITGDGKDYEPTLQMVKNLGTTVADDGGFVSEPWENGLSANLVSKTHPDKGFSFSKMQSRK